MPDIELRSGDELIRFVLFRNVVPASSVTVMRGQQKHGEFGIAPGVIDQLIAERWIVDDETRRERFMFNYDRDNEWHEQEEVRQQRALTHLLTRFSGVTFECRGYVILSNTRSMEHDTRGFMFTDSASDGFVVCEGGRITPLLRITALV